MSLDDRLPDETPAPPSARSRPGLSLLALALGVIALLMVGLAGPGTRFGWWHFRTAFQVWLKYGSYVAVLAVVVAVLALIVSRRSRSRKGLALALVALLLGLAAYLLPWSWRRGAKGVPPIHDITTDFANPPPLAYSRALRDSLDINPWEYEGDSIAAQQREAYPDIRPVMLALPPDSAYAAAYRAAREMGWEIVDASRERLTIEATDETPWFGFVDDVVIRVSPASGISRVDVRSVSRVGRGDMGLNAKRIRKYAAKLKELYPDAVAEGS
jgi:uncharacterized protein (DUF1499 family)